MSPFLEEKLARPWEAAALDGRLRRDDATLDEAFAAARAITRHHAKSFYFASVRLPASKRRAAYAVYAFCRWVDDLIDEPGNGRVPSRDELRDTLRRCLAGDSGEAAFAPAFAATVADYGIPHFLWDDLVEGCAFDREAAALETFGELERYCYYVASVVGLIMCPLFGLREERFRREAVLMGIAMQLTNILRDVGEDLRRGRRYLPAEELRDFGLSADDLLRNDIQDTERWRSMMRFQVTRARAYYTAAQGGLMALENDGSRATATLMAGLYSRILDRIEHARYRVLDQRAFYPLSWKIRYLIESDPVEAIDAPTRALC